MAKDKPRYKAIKELEKKFKANYAKGLAKVLSNVVKKVATSK